MGLMKLGVESRGGSGGIKEGIVGGLFGWKPQREEAPHIHTSQTNGYLSS